MLHPLVVHLGPRPGPTALLCAVHPRCRAPLLLSLFLFLPQPSLVALPLLSRAPHRALSDTAASPPYLLCTDPSPSSAFARRPHPGPLHHLLQSAAEVTSPDHCATSIGQWQAPSSRASHREPTDAALCHSLTWSLLLFSPPHVDR
jgi:hypothetical protein